MKVKLMNSQLEATKETVEIHDYLLDIPYNESLIHQVVTTTLTNERSGTKAQKTRAEVSGGGAKPWKQKGTGRARAGTIRSPLWRTGGITFAAKPKKYNQKINKKMYNGAMRSILSELNRSERLVVAENLHVEEAKTKALVSLLKDYMNQKLMIITKEFDVNLYLASRNLKNIFMVDVELVDPVSLVSSDKVIITADALKCLEEGLV